MEKVNKIVAISLRIPQKLINQIDQAAKQTKRSRNSMIEIMLEREMQRMIHGK